MNKQPRNFFLASGIALALATANGSVLAATPAEDISNARQEAQISTTYALSPYLRANDLKVSVEGGKATLSGNVNESVNKDLAKEIAMGVKGITTVDNQIVVNDEYKPAKAGGEPRFGDTIDDASISTAVKSKLLWSKNANGIATHVKTSANRVTLTGTVQSAGERDAAGRLARNTQGVASVDNQLKVDATKAGMVDASKDAANKAGDDISDSWITTKVKSTLLYSSNVSGTAIEVNTDSGVVTLSGTVGNGAEQTLAVELAQNVRGVKSVQSKQLLF